MERFTAHEKAMLFGAALMGVGVFMPIVRLPFVGTISYFMRGHGDGVLVLLAAGAIGALTFFSWRRTAAAIAAACGLYMVATVVRMMAAMSDAQNEAAALAEDNPFGGLAQLAVQSVGIEWGWIPLIGGASLVAIAGFIAPRNGHAHRDEEVDVGFDPDEVVARYTSKSKPDPNFNTSTSPSHSDAGATQRAFGRRIR